MAEPAFDHPLDDVSAQRVLHVAVASGYGIALHDAECALHQARLFLRSRANEFAAHEAIANARKALDAMERALPSKGEKQ